MLAVDLLSATSSFAYVLAPMLSTDALSVQPVLMTFTKAAISNSKNRSAILKYQCTQAFFLIVGSTRVEDTFGQTLLELLYTSPEQSDIAPTLTVHSVSLIDGTEFPTLDRRCNFQCTAQL
jgi:hypothetical protein